MSRRAEFYRRFAELSAVLGLELPDTGIHDYQTGEAQRARFRQLVAATPRLPESWFGALMSTLVVDPDVSSNRQFIEPAVTAYGRRRVLETLLRYLTTGSAYERAGAANAWYWAEVPVDYGDDWTPTPRSAAEYFALADLRARWHEALLREYVTTDDTEVRHSLLPALPLHPDAHPAESRELVDVAVRIASTSADEYQRHRVRLQVKIDGRLD
jgi:hypothetical protein